ncbi:helix-turn-helix domain-containing protein [Clostridium saccharobutylicum]|uniref:Helix-turn-helix domain protein n=1 Tax=Clostridium saccharobutylicum DSM 13864 TaxID=1345695 RepID=U5MWW9_CLOSA|nr:helix-turn-helix transcriptional regulator [Clostridium saccharobutylicum]AGX43922.1 helix-turn-helix domain protein [Clostridium saccharobutylicum DSM 13864]AQR91220.1 helix-turn-helix domain protein [Clostridium saccharobutylicum]AQS01124.1 helix-turn-helix domain protein [Clostridium saccharobutylicum]AQS15107.1 helix-turn-helix domain protein [Clostridium saccharobutylicum]MBA2905233.1 transcriptional regulator with XRE-family HTH domain [Clostridium saccharobutylicum]
MSGKSFGSILKEMRENQGLSMHDLGKEVNISPGYVCRLETESRDNISMDYFSRLAKRLKMPASIILEIYPDCFVDDISGVIFTLDELIVHGNFIFAKKDSDIHIKLGLQRIVQELERHILCKTRESEARLLSEIDKFKDKY